VVSKNSYETRLPAWYVRAALWILFELMKNVRRRCSAVAYLRWPFACCAGRVRSKQPALLPLQNLRKVTTLLRRNPAAPLL